MHFSSTINRPPYESRDAFLQVTSGCSHSTCRFCTFYKNAPFRVSPAEEIEEDLRELREEQALAGFYGRIFLQGADAFVLSAERLLKIADMIRTYLPGVHSIGGYARVDNVRNKSVEDLRRLHEAGYGNFYFGNESGDDHLLARMNKGHTAGETVEYLSRLDQAGMPYVMNFLGGLGGHGYGLRHAEETARMINQLHPSLIYVGELTLFPDTPLSEEVRAGTFQEADETERLQELQEFIRCLKVKTVFKAEHATVSMPIRGRLPDDRDWMIRKLDNMIAFSEKGNLQGFRKNIGIL